MGIVHITETYAVDTDFIVGIKVTQIDDIYSLYIFIDGGGWDRVAVFDSAEEAEELKQAIWVFIAKSNAQAEEDKNDYSNPPYSYPNPFAATPPYLNPPLGPPKYASSPQLPYSSSFTVTNGTTTNEVTIEDLKKHLLTGKLEVQEEQ